MEKKSELQEETQKLLESLDQRRNWDGRKICFYKGFWCLQQALCPVLSMEKNFKSQESDVILASLPKSGTVWLKALAFSIANRRRFSIDDTPLLSSSPHVLVPFLEFQTFVDNENPDTIGTENSSRILSTHLPCQALPNTVFAGKGKIIYICRNPLDHFVSYRHFLLANPLELDYEPLDIEQSLEMFSQGVWLYGPFWDHVLGYWNASLENPEKVLFLKYEDLKQDVVANMKKIAEFIGCPFSEDEEKQGVIEDIKNLCSFNSLKSLEEAILMKLDEKPTNVRKGIYRKGQVGDCLNYLTPAMAESVEQIIHEKLSGSGLSFKRFANVD